jgi:tellurite resistance protein
MAKSRVRSADAEDVAGSVLAGLVACAVIAAEGDGEIADEEREALVSVVCGLFEGLGVRAARGDVVSDAGSENFVARLKDLLTDASQRRLGCLVAAAVTTADEDVTREESATYYEIARGLGLGRAEADEIWNEALGEDGDEDEGEDSEADAAE